MLHPRFHVGDRIYMFERIGFPHRFGQERIHGDNRIAVPDQPPLDKGEECGVKPGTPRVGDWIKLMRIIDQPATVLLLRQDTWQ